ncbi:MAG: N-acetyltransferase [Bacteroidales bacterium]|nr:N-acetyltransferase [Bacteroidales bacterium]
MKDKKTLNITYNVYGGHNILAPNAKTAYQYAQRTHSTMDLISTPFANIDLSDSFFDTLRASYVGFDDWFRKKAATGEHAITYHEDGKLRDFLYLKEETEELNDINPNLPAKHRLKVGTFKIDSRGTRRGERLMKKLLDKAISLNVEEIYVTIFPEQRLLPLIRSFENFGFDLMATKTHINGKVENIYIRNMRCTEGTILSIYPYTDMRYGRFFQLGIKPEYHTRLFPDSILKNEEKYDLIHDDSETNSIYKVYLSWAKGVHNLHCGDKIVIYRTSDNQGPANYRSVCTSVCTVLERKFRSEFKNVTEFVKYALKYSVFTESELIKWYNKGENFIIIRMVYNIAFTRKVILKDLREKAHLTDKYWGFFQYTPQEFETVLKLGEINERYLIR